MSHFDCCCVFGCGNFPIQGTNICELHYRQYQLQVAASGISQVPQQVSLNNIHISASNELPRRNPPSVGGLEILT